MSFKDEEIVLSRNNQLKKEYINTRTGMYVGSQLLQFQSVKLFDRFTIEIPEAFFEMPPEWIEKKYPSKDRPQVALGNGRDKTDFTFSYFESEMPADQIASTLEHFKIIIQSVQPANQFLHQSKLDTESGNIEYMDFKSYALDGAVYNLLTIISYDSFWLLGMFHCPYSEWMLWKALMLEMIKTICEEEYDDARDDNTDKTISNNRIIGIRGR